MHDDNAATERELALHDFIRRFESQRLSKTEWTHAAHVRIGGCYVLAHGPAVAIQELRAASAHPRTTRAALIEALVDRFGQRSALFEDYWTIDVARSVEARRNWVAPDKLPLDVAALSLSGNDQHYIFG